MEDDLFDKPKLQIISLLMLSLGWGTTQINVMEEWATVEESIFRGILLNLLWESQFRFVEMVSCKMSIPSKQLLNHLGDLRKELAKLFLCLCGMHHFSLWESQI